MIAVSRIGIGGLCDLNQGLLRALLAGLAGDRVGTGHRFHGSDLLPCLGTVLSSQMAQLTDLAKSDHQICGFTTPVSTGFIADSRGAKLVSER